MLAVGWVSWERASLVYGPIRFRHAADAVLACGDKKVEARASIVPFCGGQVLMLTLMYGLETIECMDFRLVDHENAEIADQPPNGHASAAALEHAPTVIAKFIWELAHGWGLTTVAVMCGQGLVEHVDYLDAQLKAGCAGVWEPLEDVLVYASSSTYAAEESGLPPNMEAMPGAMEAMLRRLFNE